MTRLAHGQFLTPQDLQLAQETVASAAAGHPVAFAVALPVDLHDVDYLFPELAGDPEALLPESAATVQHLTDLGRAMADQDAPGEEHDSGIPAAYTYLGQFLDHDISLETGATTSTHDLVDPGMTPQDLGQIRSELRNARTATLDLDSLYDPPAPRDPADAARMLIGTTSPTGSTQPPLAPIAGKGADNDLPRQGRQPGEPKLDRAALIGDPRNDENTIISQLHVAFLKAHNALVDEGRSFEQARRVLRQHYQHLVLHDFLPRVCDPGVVEDVLARGNRHYDAMVEPFFLPMEFSFAAYRFGHSMVRGGYDFNANFSFASGIPATLELLFTFSALSGQLGDFDTLPENWVVEWEHLVGDDPGVMHARRLDTRLAKAGDLALFNLQTVDGTREVGLEAFLAVRNLLRGYRLRLPTGQAVARRLGLPPLTPQQLLDEAESQAQKDALTAGGFLDRTPLWYYVLAEAGHHGGQHLGPLGSTILAEVFVGLVRRSEDSVLRTPWWAPSLPSRSPGTFDLADLLAFAGVLGHRAPAPRRYTVQPADTLSSIARRELGAADRWPEIFALNRAVVRHPHLITPGQVLTLPGATPAQPSPRLHVVRAGETLSSIATGTLGDAGRWPEIFSLNGDVLTDPDRIVVGQVLVLPPRTATIVLDPPVSPHAEGAGTPR